MASRFEAKEPQRPDNTPPERKLKGGSSIKKAIRHAALAAPLIAIGSDASLSTRSVEAPKRMEAKEEALPESPRLETPALEELRKALDFYGKDVGDQVTVHEAAELVRLRKEGDELQKKELRSGKTFVDAHMYTSEAKEKEFTKEENAKINEWEKQYYNNHQEFQRLLNKSYSQRRIDPTTRQRIYERHDPSGKQMQWKFFESLGGKPQREEEYKDEKLLRQTEFEQGQARYITTFGKNGEAISVYSVSEKQHDFLDSEGRIKYRIKGEEKLIADSHGQLFNPERMRAAEFQERVTTKEQYMIFEELFPQNMSIPEYKAKRAYGKKVCGIDKLEKALQDRLGTVEIDTEGDRHWFSASNCSMVALEKLIPFFLKEIEKYPPQFIQNSGLKIFFIRAGRIHDPRKNEDETFKDIRGKYLPGAGAMVVNDTTSEHVFHHELSHCFNDKEDHSIQLLMNWWEFPGQQKSGGKFHDEDFSRLYGQTNHMEDKATMAEDLFNPLKSRELRSRAIEQAHAGKPILAQKIRAIEQRYYGVSEGRMDQKFWSDIIQGVKIDASYWKQREQGHDFVIDPEGEHFLKWYQNDKKLQEELKKAEATPRGKARQQAMAEAYLRARKQGLFYQFEYARGFYNTINALLQSSEKKLDTSERQKYYERWLNDFPESPTYLYLGLIEVYEESHQYDKVVTLYQ